MSIDSQLLNLTGGIKTSGHIQSNFGATIGVGTDAPTGIVEVQHSQPTLVVQQQASEGASVTSYGKVHATSGTLHIQSGIDATSDSKGDIVLGSVGSGTKHVVVKGATSRVGIGSDAPAYGLDVVPESRFTGNVTTSNISANILTLNELSLGVTQGLDNIVNVDNTTSNTIAMSNVDASTSTTTGALTVAGGIGVGGNVHCSNLYASNITMNLVSFTGLHTFEQVVNNGRVLNSNVLIISNVTPSTSSTTGALTLTGGGLGVAGNVHVGTAGQIVVSNATPSTSSTTGALTVAGGVGVAGNVHVGSKLSVSNLTVTGETVEVANLAVTSGSLELTQVANVFQVKSSSNVVTEYVRSKKLIKYPRVAMSGATTSGYTASASTSYSGGVSAAWRAFDGVNDANADSVHSWDSGAGTYTGATPGVGQSSSFDGKTGEYINLKLPNKIRVISYQHWTRMDRDHEGPHQGFLYGSNDGFSTYTLLHDFDNIKLPSVSMGVTYTHEVNSEGYYDEYRLLVTETQASPYVNIAELAFHGIPEHDPDAHGTDVIARSVPNVPNTDWLEVYYDGQDYTSMPSTITDKSGNGLTGTPTNVTFDSTWKAFSFDGSGDDIQSGNIGLSGDQSITVSLWFRYNSIPAGRQDIFGVGKPGTATQFGIATYTPGTYLYTGGNDIYNTSYDLVTDTNWHHITAVYRGGTPSTTTMALYLDSVNIVSQLLSSSASQAANFDSSNCKAFLGNNANLGAALNGKIANFRLFNRALTADEAWQLYAYQKDYFQVSPDVVTFKGGRLGIGTEEPKAVLDVRGTLHAHGSVVQVVTNPVVGQHSYSANAAEVEIAALTTSFSPKFSDSLVLVQVYLSYEADYNAVIYIRANGNDIPTNQGRTYGKQEGVIPVSYDNDVSSTPNSSTFAVHHTLNGETSVEYKVYYRTNSSAGTLYLNRGYSTVDEKGMSYVVITEIGQ